MIFKPFYAYGRGCAGYLLGCAGEGLALAVDPLEEDVDAYLAFAAEHGLRITWVVDTHVHADHRSGARELAARAGARYGLHREADVAFPFEPLEDGQALVVGKVEAQVLHTPGHTPESLCLLVTDRRRGPEPWMVLTGDTLFSGGVGRPDLPGRAREDAARLHESLHRKLLTLPDWVEVHPGHFGGSACGAGLSGKPMSTVGFERRHQPLLGLDREAFVARLLETLPERPAHMEAILRFNQGRAA